MDSATTHRNQLNSGDLAAAARPARLTPDQIRWCPSCRRYRGPAGRFLSFETVRRAAAAARRERQRLEAERAIAAVSRVSVARARQTAASLVGVAPPAVTPAPTRDQTRAARTAAILFDTPKLTTPYRPSRADARAARTAQLLFG